MKNYVLKISMLLSSVFLLQNCNHKTAVEPEEFVSKDWQLHLYFSDTTLNPNFIHIVNDTMYVIGEGFIMGFNNKHERISFSKFDNVERLLTPYQIAANDSFFAYPNYYKEATSIFVRSLQNPALKREIIIDYSRGGIYNNPKMPCCVITKDNHVIIPINDRSVSSTQGVNALLEIALAEFDGVLYSFFNKKIILPADNYYTKTDMKLLNDDEVILTGHYNLIVNIRNSTFRYKENKTKNSKISFFNNTYYMFGYKTPSNAFSISRLEANAAFVEVDTIHNNFAQRLDFHTVENNLLGVNATNELYHIKEINPNDFVINKLNTKNINSIVAIKRFKNRIYIATKNGLYYKLYSDFISVL